MFKSTSLICLCVFGISLALPSPLSNPEELDSGPRYQYATDSAGKDHLVDMWMTVDSAAEAVRFDPRQPCGESAVLIHGWMGSAISDFNTVLIPVLLAAEDVNVVVVDWSAGASSINYRTVIANTIASGQAVAAFINFINQEMTSIPEQYHIVGHGFGGHQAGIVGRNVQGNVAYITALDPAFLGWVNHIDRFAPNDGLYTEVIHTNYGINGYLADLGQVDFYPNGGISMPGCNSNECDHARSFFYFAESITSGGFTGRQCLNYVAAILSMCDVLPGRLQMGGLRPKIGSSGVYLLETNAAPPFSLE